jgi:hypothetical protein
MSEYIVKARHSQKGERIFPAQPDSLETLFHRDEYDEKVVGKTIYGQPITKRTLRITASRIRTVDRFAVIQIIQRLTENENVDRIIISKVR